MGLISKTVMVKWHGKIRKHYESLGYVYTKKGDEFEVSIEDLTKGSHVKVDCKCDGCGKDLTLAYKSYISQAKEDGKTYCCTCGKNLAINGVAFSKSFYDWCVENDRQDVLERWDYELNNCSPKEIAYRTIKECYFKCNLHPDHKSELKIISSFTRGREGSIACNQCNSIAQYILDNFPNKDLYDIWDKDKNIGSNPWEISKGNNTKKYWFICQEKDYHNSYEATCNDFTRGNRCPYCSSKKVHPKDSLGQYIIDNYGEYFLHKVWSNKNDMQPFDLSIKSSKKVWWKCLNKSHQDYQRSCKESVMREFRCSECVNGMNNSIIEEKTKLYLEGLKYTLLHEHNCTIRPVNPKTKKPMPYDNEVILHNGKHLIIEVHGEQHYNSRYYRSINKCSNEEAEKMLKQRKLYDRYKKYIAWKNNYEYLELPYWSFEGKNKDLYKQMIDNKIKEILEKEEIA